MTKIDMEVLFDEIAPYASKMHSAVADALFGASKEMLEAIMVMLTTREDTISNLKFRVAAQEAQIADLTAKLGVK
jgi:hypothetical protein